MVVGQGPPSFQWELADRIVNQYPVEGVGPFPHREPSADQPSLLGDLGPYRSPEVEPPLVEALGPRRKAVAVVRQDGLLQVRILAGLLRGQVQLGESAGRAETGAPCAA